MKYQSLTERSEFRTRLICALNDAQCKVGATAIAREFNRRSNDRPVSVYAVRKWLAGEAIPTQDKLVILADWLNVPAQWLRFGEECAGPTTIEHLAGLPPAMLALLDDIVRLDEAAREMVAGVIALLLKDAPAPT